jgi:hypothetical protein
MRSGAWKGLWRSMCDSDFDNPIDMQSRWRFARKAHVCFACKETIRSGDRYHVSVQLYESEIQHFKHCARCWMLCEAILEAGAESVQWDLHCDETWEGRFGPIPDNVAVLAFMTPDEAQAEAKP